MEAWRSATPLQAWQTALMAQLRADALRSLGQNAEATAALNDAIALHCSPLAGLQWLQEEWQNPESASQRWAVVSRYLVQQGNGPAVLRTLMAALAQLPLQGQREALLQAIEDTSALMLDKNPALERQWRWLRRAAPAGGSGFWA
jgi:DNA-directed RNA polymerase specialized sigma24 family protein